MSWLIPSRRNLLHHGMKRFGPLEGNAASDKFILSRLFGLGTEGLQNDPVSDINNESQVLYKELNGKDRQMRPIGL